MAIEYILPVFVPELKEHMTKTLPELRIGDLSLAVPVIQGGMGVAVSKASLAAAVSAQGGLGVIASVGLGEDLPGDHSYTYRSAEALRIEIRKVKQQNLPVGVNIMVALTNFQNLVEVCVEEKVDVIISGAGLPLKLPEFIKGSSTKIVPIVSSGRAAALLLKTWQSRHDRLPDAVLVEGPMAGGHLGFKFDPLVAGTAEPLETLLADVLKVVKEYETRHSASIPVIAAGGIFTGEDIAKFINLGAGGVQMGTRFVATDECDASIKYKQAYVDAKEQDVAIIQSPVGLPARVIMNDFVQKSLVEKMKFGCPYKCLHTCNADEANYCIAETLLHAARGIFEDGFAMCGENVHRIDKIVSVEELMKELVEDAEKHL